VFVSILLLILFLMILLIPLLEHQIIILVNKTPEALSWLQQTAIPWLQLHLGIQLQMNFGDIKKLISSHWEQASNLASLLVRTATHSGYTIFVFLLNLILIPVVTFYLLRDWDDVVDGIHRLIPRKIEPTVVNLVNECNEVLGAFFRGQLLVMLAVGIYYAASLSLVGLELALLIGLIIGFMSIVPYLGFILGISLACISAFVQFHDGLHLAYVLLIFTIGHVLESYVLYPLLVGDRIGLHPVAVIFAILAGGQLFGFVGILLALPVAAIIMVMLRYIIRHYLNSGWYSAKKIGHIQ
jgi:predicted PurR-regulated permease PerM